MDQKVRGESVPEGPEGEASKVLKFASEAEPSFEVLRKADEADQRNTGQYRE